MAFLFLGILISYIDRGNLSVAANAMMADFGFSTGRMGVLLSSFFWTYALVMIPAGMLVDRYGIKRMYLIGLGLWSLAGALIGVATNFWQLVLLRALLGLGESVAPVASIVYIKRNFTDEEQGLPTGIYVAGALVGPAIGTFVGAALLEPLGWRMLFVVTGLAGALWLAPWAAVAPKHERVQKVDGGKTAEEGVNWLEVAMTPLFWAVTFGAFFYSYYWYFILTWAPSYLLTVHGYSNLKMGVILSVPMAVTAVTSLMAGTAADQLIKKTGASPLAVRKTFVAVAFLCASSIVLLAYMPVGTSLLPLFLLSMGGMGLGVSNYWALTNLYTTKRSIGRAMGYQNMVGQLAGVAAPIVTGLLVGAERNFTLAILIAGLSPLIAAAVLIAGLRPRETERMKRLLGEDGDPVAAEAA